MKWQSWFVIGAALVSGGCAGIFDGFSGWFGSSSVDSGNRRTPGGYGLEMAVLETAERVKSAGDATVISSRAITLPSNPMSAITAYAFQFPASCGGHRFRLYEADGLQILEYSFPDGDRQTYLIRDYIAGPSPFVHAGLWSAYDHTDGNVADMNMKFETRGDGLLTGTYSQGPVTGLNALDQEMLGRAYAQALQETRRCNI